MRTCSKCNKDFEEGYYAEGNYYCSDECLLKDYTPEEWTTAHQENSDENYWTVFDE